MSFNEIETLQGTALEKMQTRSVKTRDRLLKRKKELEEELKYVEEAINLFNEYPYLAQALDLLGKIRI